MPRPVHSSVPPRLIRNAAKFLENNTHARFFRANGDRAHVTAPSASEEVAVPSGPKYGRNVSATSPARLYDEFPAAASHKLAVLFMATIRITLAGNVIVEVDGRRLSTEALGPRGRVVLACLVLERHRLLPVGELAEATWGMDLPDTWRPALRGARVDRAGAAPPLPPAAAALD